MGGASRGVKPSLDGAACTPCALGMNVRSLLALALASSALLALGGCGGPKRRTVSGGEPAAGGNKNLDRYDSQVAVVREIFPKETRGSALVVRLYNASKDIKISLVYQDKSAPEYKPKSQSNLVLAEARNGSELLSTLSILHKNWQPGRYVCGNDTLIGFSLGAGWDPGGPDTYGSWNGGGGCEFELRPSQLVPGDLEGTFRGVFAQRGGAKLTIQDGYIYVKAFTNAQM